jgi:sodium-dependent phosphate transporter
MWGMCSVCFCVGVWLLIATYLELPVSTTHSCVGGIVGFTLVAVGPKCVIWNAKSEEFPYVKGIASIVTSWVFSPVFSAICASLIFLTTRTLVLRSKHSVARAMWCYPLVVMFCTTMIAFYVVLKGMSGVNKMLKFDAEGKDLGISCAICFGFGGLCGVLSLLMRPTIRRAVDAAPDVYADPPKAKMASIDVAPVVKEGIGSKNIPILSWLVRTLDTDVDQLVADDPKMAHMHAIAEKFSPKTEAVFRYMQVITACFDSFAHGANDVANAMGPFTAVYYVHKEQGDYAKSNAIGIDMYWILALGGAGIVFGLGTYGYKIMFALGMKLAKMTPSRGYSVELGSMFVVLLGSRFGIPLSTTHCQVGATIGVSLTEGQASSTNWTLVGKCIAGWIFTMNIAALLTAAVFSMGYAGIDYDSTQKLQKGWQGF